VTRRRALLVVILVYVSLDLSLAMMPGAFVFDAGDSVESLHVTRGPATPELVASPAATREDHVLVRPDGEVIARLAAPASAERHGRRVLIRLHRPPADVAPPSEDSH
jgi:hypothetical protein